MTDKYTPHTYGGFRGSFTVTNNRPPTEQEIFDAGMRAGRDIKNWPNHTDLTSAKPSAWRIYINGKWQLFLDYTHAVNARVTHFNSEEPNCGNPEEMYSRSDLEALKPSARFYCKKCSSPRKGSECWKCGSPTIKPSGDWVSPATPPIDPIRALAKEVGYALSVHGSLERDLDLIAAPWTEDAVSPRELAEHIAKGINGQVVDSSNKPLGRFAVNIQIDGYFKLIDLSICPRVVQPVNGITKIVRKLIQKINLGSAHK